MIEGISALKQFNQKKSNGPKSKKNRHNFKFGGGADLLDVEEDPELLEKRSSEEQWPTSQTSIDNGADRQAKTIGPHASRSILELKKKYGAQDTANVQHEETKF